MEHRAVRGRLHGRHIELDEQIDELDGEVEVYVRAAEPRVGEDILAVIATLPPGGQPKHEIDRALARERDDWSRRG